MRARPATVGLIVLLVAVHGVGGLWGWQHGEVDSAWQAFVAERPSRLRILLGGQYLPLVSRGAWWRLATSGAVHAGAVHLAVNAVVLGALGWLLEPRLGAVRWLGVVALGAVAGAALSHVAGVAQSDGVSGGVFALLGAGMGIGRRWPDVDASERRLLVRGLGGFAAANVALSFVVPSLGAAAHVGGLLAGLFAGHAVRPDGGTAGWKVLLAAWVGVAAAGWSGWLGR